MTHFDLFGTYDTLVFDITNILFNGNEEKYVPFGTHILKSMMNTNTWYHYETERISNAEVFSILSGDFGIDQDTIDSAITDIAKNMKPRIDIFRTIKDLKPGRRIYATGNLSAFIWDIIRTHGGDLWDVFDHIFISGSIGARKPELRFYQHVIGETGLIPERTIFIDDTRESLVSAQSLGIRTLLYDTYPSVERHLYNLWFDPISRASQFLMAHAKKHFSYTLSSGEVIHENFCQLLILEATKDPSLVNFTTYEAECNFFNNCAEFTTLHYPNDLDTTSVTWTIYPDLADSSTKKRVMDRMLTFCDGDGIPLTYFDCNRPRRDHVIAINIITLFFSEGRGADLQPAVDWIFSMLRTGAYLEGSRYYVGAEPFLYSVLCLLKKGPALDSAIRNAFKEQCTKRVGSPGDSLALAMRVHCCTRAGVDNETDLIRLLDMQQLDGGWEAGCFYRYGMTDRRVGNRGLTTAIAQRAIREYSLKYTTSPNLDLLP